jgi:hypothetical protein
MRKISAQATFGRAIREPFNWFILLPALLAIFSGVLKLISAWLAPNGWDIVLGMVLTVLGLTVTYLQLRSIGTLFFELTDEGLRYEGNGRKVFIAWKDVETVKLEPSRKQLMVWVQGKPQRLLYVGVAEDEFAKVNQFLQVKLSEYGIGQTRTSS